MFELSAGQIVADKYRIEGVMASGGMGVVVAATHLELDQRVAIKFLREVSTEALARFQREARLLVRLKSPHVARVFDVGALDDDTPYIVMEHLDGEDLATVVSARPKLPVAEAVDYILQACEAVAEAHAMGMVHRDLKPANLFLARGPGNTTTIKVLDFGVSKILDDRGASGREQEPRGGDLTHEGVALGSPGYMSPEQMTSSRDVDARSDIFSLGALLYRMVAGKTPYRGASVVSILASMATEGMAPLRSLTPEAPPPFAAAVERCLAQDKAVRFPTVAHFAHALAPYATRRGRVSIEQVLAVLNVHIDDVLDTMTDPSLLRGSQRPPPVGPGALGSGPGAPAPPRTPHHRTTNQTGPHRPVSATGPVQPSLRPGSKHWARLRVPLAILGLLLFGLATFFITWLVLRPREPRVPSRAPASAEASTPKPGAPPRPAPR